MTNATGTKSAPTTKTSKAAKKATVAALSAVVNRRLAASGPKPARKNEGASMPLADVPEWAQRAANRDTPAEMAAVPEAPSTPAPVPVAPNAKEGRPPKPAKPKTAAPTPAAPGSLRAIGDCWLASLRAAGHTPSTISSYGNDLAIAYEHLGGDSAASALTEKQIAAFNESKAVIRKKNGKAKAMPTILKTRRALRLALTWAAHQKLIAKAPYAAKTPA
jgi:hypothetical protein